MLHFISTVTFEICSELQDGECIHSKNNRCGGAMIRYHLDKTNSKALAFSSTTLTQEDTAAMAQPHSPETFLICCIDSRIQPNKVFNYGAGVTLEHRPIACSVPPPDKADPDLLSRLAFRRLQEIKNIVLVCHSDCGGAQAALKVSCNDHTACDDTHAVAFAVHRSGINVHEFANDCMCDGRTDIREAGDKLAKAVGLKSLHNLMQYKGAGDHATIADEIAAGDLNVMLFFYDLEHRHFEVYDAAQKEWRHMNSYDGMFPTSTETKPRSIAKKRAG